MKWLSKINRGVILTFIVLIGVIVYLISMGIMQSKEKVLIEKVCTEYIQTATKYEMLPEENKKSEPNISGDALNTYLDTMEKDMAALYFEKTGEEPINQMKENLKKQAKGQGIVYKYDKEVIEFKDLAFDGNSASIIVSTRTTLNGPQVEENYGSVYYSGGVYTEREKKVLPSKEVVGETSEKINLIRDKGEWKVTFAELKKPSSR